MYYADARRDRYMSVYFKGDLLYLCGLLVYIKTRNQHTLYHFSCNTQGCKQIKKKRLPWRPSIKLKWCREEFIRIKLKGCREEFIRITTYYLFADSFVYIYD